MQKYRFRILHCDVLLDTQNALKTKQAKMMMFKTTKKTLIILENNQAVGPLPTRRRSKLTQSSVAFVHASGRQREVM